MVEDSTPLTQLTTPEYTSEIFLDRRLFFLNTHTVLAILS